MNTELNTNLQRSIDLTLDAVSKTNILWAAASNWQETHTEMTGAADMVYDLQRQLLTVDEHLNQVKGHVTSTAPLPQQKAPTPLSRIHPERAGDGLRALLDANDMLAVLEAALNHYVEVVGQADADIAGRRLLTLAQDKIYDAVDVLRDVKDHLQRCR